MSVPAGGSEEGDSCSFPSSKGFYLGLLITSVDLWKLKCQSLWEGSKQCVHGLVCFLLSL